MLVDVAASSPPGVQGQRAAHRDTTSTVSGSSSVRVRSLSTTGSQAGSAVLLRGGSITHLWGSNCNAPKAVLLCLSALRLVLHV